MQSNSPNTSPANALKIVIITSSYHSGISGNLAQGAESAFIDAGGLRENCEHIQATGAWELPILANEIAKASQVDAIVALGCIITGETTHGRIIGDAVAGGIMSVALEWGNPVSMGVLTCQTIAQAEARSSTSSNKGAEAMRAAINTAVTLKEMRA